MSVMLAGWTIAKMASERLLCKRYVIMVAANVMHAIHRRVGITTAEGSEWTNRG